MSKQNEPHYIDGRGAIVTFAAVANLIRKSRPDMIGKHVLAQLDAIGLRGGFDNGRTVYPIPHTFV